MSEEENQPSKTESQVNKSSDSAGSPQAGISAFWAELRRRKVMRVAITYIAVAWVILQVAGLLFPVFDIPVVATRLITILLVCCFPIAVIITWAFELTPDGIRTTKSAREEQGEKPVSKKQQRKRDWTAYAVGAALPTLIFGTLALVFYLRSGGDDRSVEYDKSIAVLPLVNMSPDPENAYFADGIHEEILTNLANIGELFVIGRTSVLQFRDTVKSLRQIGEELNVRYLLEGSVQREQNRAAITLQLIDAQTEGHLWAQTYDRILDDLIAVRTAVAKDVAQELQATLLPEEVDRVEKRPTDNQEAYDYYLLAKTTRRPEQFALLERATRLDPDFYDAWRLLASRQVNYWRYLTWRSDEALRKAAYEALAHVKRLAPDTAETLSLEAEFAVQVHDDVETALLYELKARSLGLGGENVGLRYLQLGRLEEARFNAEETLRRDPLNRSIIYRLYRIYIHLGLWDEARSFLESQQQKSERELIVRFGHNLLLEHDYLRSGDRGAYLAARKAALSAADNPREGDVIWESLVSRDHRRSLQLLEDYSRWWVQLIGPSSTQYHPGLLFAPLDLVSALLWFEIGERDKWLEKAGQAKTFLLTEKRPPADLAEIDYWGYLAIIYALEGDRPKMESMITISREKAAPVNVRYRFQAFCELQIAIAYLILGDHEKAIEILEAACAMDSIQFVKRDLDLWFIFDRLRGNSRFDALLKDKG